MKLWRCDWVPSSVADWLSRELEDRGIPGTTYTHTLLSLLHPYFCPHPVPKNSINTSNYSLKTEDIKTVFKSGLPGWIKGICEELEDYVHPDADFPELKIDNHIKEGSRRSKKRQKKKLQELTFTPEKLWKVAALQCLLTSSDELQELTSLVEELFLRLKVTNKDCFGKKENSADPVERHFFLERYPDCNIDPSPALSDQDISYCFNFPPLSQLTENILFDNKTTIDWKSLSKSKLASPTKTFNLPPSVRVNDVTLDLESSFTDTDNNCMKLEMDIGPKSFNETKSTEKGTLCMIPTITDTICRYSTEDPMLDDKIIGHIFSNNEKSEAFCKNVNKLEEWECAGEVLPTPENHVVSVDFLGSRLFERSLESIGASSCNSVVDFSSNEEELMKYVDVRIASASKVWGYSSDTPTVDSLLPEKVWHAQEAYLARKQATLDSNTSLEGSHIYNTKKEEISQFSFKNRSWPYLEDDNSINSFDQKDNSLFSNDFHCSPPISEKERMHQDCSISERNNESFKSIWSDLNDNDVQPVKLSGMQPEPTISSRTDVNILRDCGEENLCETFQQLGLGHLWQNKVLLDHSINDLIVSENYNSDASPSVTMQDNVNEESAVNQNDIFASIDLGNRNISPSEELGDELVLTSIPSGPSGPYIQLQHTDASGFCTVVPHKGLEVIEDLLTIEKELILISKGNEIVGSSDQNLHSQEEENLLTSPRTHFRPIWQDRRGSIIDDKFDEGQAFLNLVSDVKDSGFNFQRTESGNLFLENDMLDGSPKKYMVYREPTGKTGSNSDLSSNSEVTDPQLEKTIGATSFIPKFKIINNEKFCQTEENDSAVSKNFEEEFEVHHKGSINQFHENQSENFLEPSYSDSLKLLWDDEPKTICKEAWELEATAQATSFSNWPADELNTKNWSSVNDEHRSFSDCMTAAFGSQTDSKFNNYSNTDEDNTSFSKIKFIWHDSVKNSYTSPVNISNTSNSSLKEKYSDESWKLQDSNRGFIDNKMSGHSDISDPWNKDNSFKKLASSGTDIGPSVYNCQYEKPEDTPLWQMQWEVDQEADELLGKLIPLSPLGISPQEESVGESQIVLEDFNFMKFLETPDFVPPPIEDLANLEPDWDLNDGFEWLPATEQVEGDDDREVIFYKNEEGETLMVPVEYLDDNLYDEIFGAENSNPIGGSLPDLPHGQLAEWKKLNRRPYPAGSRFVPPSRRPCSFFLEGNCRRSDCKFSHDLITITCRFWEEGSCLKGETCPFRHGFLPSRRRNRSEGDQASVINRFSSSKDGLNITNKGRSVHKRIRGSMTSVSSFEIDSEADFPCLGSSVESKGEVLDEHLLLNKVKITKLSKKKKKAVSVSKNILTNVENDLKASSSSKSRKAVRHKLKYSKSSSETASESTEFENLVAKVVEKSECESLKKILRKRTAHLPQQIYSYEDGTVSDF